MFFSKVFLVAIFLGAISALATPTACDIVHPPPPPPPPPPSSTQHNTPSPTSASTAGSHTGWATHYSPSVGTGACGQQYQDTDMVCAIDFELFIGFDGFTGGDPNLNPICNKSVQITHNGKSITVKAVDECPGCNGKYNIDLSPTAFSQLADQGLGNISITWQFL